MLYLMVSIRHCSYWVGKIVLPWHGVGFVIDNTKTIQIEPHWTESHVIPTKCFLTSAVISPIHVVETDIHSFTLQKPSVVRISNAWVDAVLSLACITSPEFFCLWKQSPKRNRQHCRNNHCSFMQSNGSFSGGDCISEWASWHPELLCMRTEAGCWPDDSHDHWWRAQCWVSLQGPQEETFSLKKA